MHVRLTAIVVHLKNVPLSRGVVLSYSDNCHDSQVPLLALTQCGQCLPPVTICLHTYSIAGRYSLDRYGKEEW